MPEYVPYYRREKIMHKKLFTLFAIILTSFSLDVSAGSIACPPNTAIHCTQGNCTLDAPYASNWSIYPVGNPNGMLIFGDALVQDPPGRMNCRLGSAHKSYVDLYSNDSYSPDTSVSANAWVSYPGNMWICEAANNPGACLFY